MKPIVLKQWEVTALLNGATMLARPLEPQPGKISIWSDRIWIMGKNGVWCDGYGWQKKAPYQVGDPLYGKETWTISDNTGGCEYRADYGNALCQDLITWRPSVHMPEQFSRIHLLVTGVKATNTPTTEEIKAMKFEENLNDITAIYFFECRWNADYPKYPWGSWMWLYEVERE